MRDAVLDAALAELEQGGTTLSLPELAARAGVAPSSIYRRWGTWEAVVADAVLGSSAEAVPVPDTGTLRGDLVAYAGAIAAYLDSPRGYALARGAVLQGARSGTAREQFWKTRFEAALPMLDRARARGELVEADPGRDLLLIELVVAPLHLRRLVTGADVRADLAERIDLLLRAVAR